jgi:hypothetical protein
VGLKNQIYINIYIQENGGFDESKPCIKKLRPLAEEIVNLMNQDLRM